MGNADIVDRLVRFATEDPDRLLYTELLDGREESARLTFGQFHARAAALGAHITAQGHQPGEVAVLVATSPVEFMVGLFGAMHAGVIAAPIAFPRRVEHIENHIGPVASDAGATFVLAGPAINRGEKVVVDALLAGPRPVLTTDAEVPEGEPAKRQPPSDVAYLQYTSGSTSRPKGVIIPHPTLTDYLDAWARLVELDDTATGISWLPLTHDLGLACSALPAVHLGYHAVLLTPAAFVRRPARFVQCMSRYRATHFAGPNFGYDLLVDRVTPEELEGVDLSAVRCAGNGAEAVRERTRLRFLERYEPLGFDPQAWAPGWGMAESTCGITASGPGRTPITVWFDSHAMESGQVLPVDPEAPGSRSLCGNGPVDVEHELRIVDPDTFEALPPDRVGEVWLRGPAICAGYWRHPEETDATFDAYVAGSGDGPYLRTGDLGFVFQDELFICSRLKHLIVIRGRNIYPHDVELCAELSHPAIRPGCTAGFDHDMPDGEVLVLVCEVQEGADADEVVTAVRRAVGDEFDVSPEVVLVPAWTVPKTTSGKLQREAARALWVERGTTTS